MPSKHTEIGEPKGQTSIQKQVVPYVPWEESVHCIPN